MTREEALALLIRAPAQVARWCGYPLLRDELHGKWIRDMMHGGEDMTLLAHRGSYKTTCLAMAMASLVCIRPAQTMLFMRKTDEDAAEIIRQVRRILQTDAFRYITAQLYGEPVTVGRGPADVLTCSCYAAPRGAAQLTGCGVGGTLTGRHADIIFTDDIVTLRDRVSPPERERTKGVYMELQNVRNRGGRIVNIGTPWHRDDALTLMPNHQRYDWRRTGLISPEEASSLRESMSPSLFAANYELRHMAQEDALFADAPPMTGDAAMLRGGVAHLDASYGGSDWTALSMGRIAGGRLYLYGRMWHKHVDSVMDECIALADAMGCRPIWCETNGDRGYVARELRRRGAEVRAYHESAAKHLKIATHLRAWWKKCVLVEGTDAEYVGQIIDYTEHAAHDDAPDSAACLCRILDQESRRYMG